MSKFEVGSIVEYGFCGETVRRRVVPCPPGKEKYVAGRPATWLVPVDRVVDEVEESAWMHTDSLKLVSVPAQSKDSPPEPSREKRLLDASEADCADWRTRYFDAANRATVLADEAGTLRTERDELLRENATLRRKVERLERRR